RPRHCGSLLRPTSPWAWFMGRLAWQLSQRMMALAPRVEPRSLIVRAGLLASVQCPPWWTHQS
ncbi:hypothetical protein NL452_26520, partial [Klebsiella pneumoniae]|nr:hypothetical protein [Klebsiella pneumoniae]